MLFKLLAQIVESFAYYALNFDFRGVDKFTKREIFGGYLVDAELLHAVDIACLYCFKEVFGQYVHRENLIVHS